MTAFGLDEVKVAFIMSSQLLRVPGLPDLSLMLSTGFDASLIFSGSVFLNIFNMPSKMLVSFGSGAGLFAFFLLAI